MDPLSPHGSFSIFAYPYQDLISLEDPAGLLHHGPAPSGSSLVWDLSKRCRQRDIPVVANRPPGMALIIVLPPADRITEKTPLLDIAELCRPSAVMPFHPRIDPDDLSDLMREGPENLPVAITDFLQWRGVRIDRDTRHLVRRTVELSREIRTVEGLSRALYLSRRALGRRLVSRRLPVPSHWLQFSRLLRAALLLQTSRSTLDSIALDLGYPDGFSLSNQMIRLVGVRPSTVRERLGWEWILESWLRTEQEEGMIDLPAYPSRGLVPGQRAPSRAIPTRPAAPPTRAPTPWRTPVPVRGRPRT